MNTNQYAKTYEQEAYALLKTLAAIPAPSNHEEKRAAFCLEWLRNQGVSQAYMDEAQNVVIPFGVTQENPVAVVMAHMDVVFEDQEALPVREEEERLYAPGVGDDTANLTVLLMAARYLSQSCAVPRDMGVLLVCNTGEEGLGNLRGCRHIVETYGSRIQEFTSLDGSLTGLVTKAVGSKRFRVEVRTEGGHSYGSFGNRNAIAYMASLIQSLYAMKVPNHGRTTFNVGRIQGGTSVNSIAQQCEMLYEFRSDSEEDLRIMDEHFHKAIEYYSTKGIRINVKLLGERPCGAAVDPARQAALTKRCQDMMSRYNGGIHPEEKAGSTDCNIPLSLGIPSVCFGCYTGQGAHTREEFVERKSLLPGLSLGLDWISSYFTFSGKET